MLTHLKANAIAYAALFVALGGTSYAAVKLPAGSVGTKELRHDAVTKSRIHRDAVTSLRVLDHTLKAVDFAPGQLKAGPKGDQGPTGAAGAKGDVGPTLGVAGLDAGTREQLRQRLRRRLLGHGPDRPMVLDARAWAVRGTVP